RRLAALDGIFLESVAQKDAPLAAKIKELRKTQGEGVPPQELSAILIEAGKHLSEFIAKIFHIEDAATELNQRALGDRVIFECRRKFMDRRVLKNPLTTA